MYYGRKKGIIITVVIIAIILVIGIAGTCLYMFTDLFKSDENLFWKYMDKGLGSVKLTNNAQMEEIQKKKEQTPYTTTGELAVSSTDKDAKEVLEKLKLSINSETDKINDYSHTKTNLEYADISIFDLDYVHDEDLYALKSDEIVTVYLGIRNKNLNVLMQKLGIKATFDIPEEIVLNDYSTLKLTDEEKNHINETYSNVILKNISKDCYSKQTEAVIKKEEISYTTTSYRLDLSAELVSKIALDILNTLKTDSITLNLLATKATTIGLDEQYTTIDGLNKIIDEMIEKVQSTEFVDMSFVVYSYKGETIATEVLLRNTAKITIYAENSIKITYENLELDAEFNIMNLEITNNNTSTQSNLNIKANVDGNKELILDIVNIGSATQGTLDTTVTASITNEGKTYTVDYAETTEFVNELQDVIDLTDTNCAVLNDYSQNDLNVLMQAIVNQIVMVYNQKAQMLGIINWKF